MKLEDLRRIAEVGSRSSILPIEIRYKNPDDGRDVTTWGYFGYYEERPRDYRLGRFEPPYLAIAHSLDHNWTPYEIMERLLIRDIHSLSGLRRVCKYGYHDEKTFPPFGERIELRRLGDLKIGPTITVAGYFIGCNRLNIEIGRYLDERGKPQKREKYRVRDMQHIQFSILEPVELEEFLRKFS